MALYAFDGTWNEEKTGDDGQATNSNVVKFFRAYAKNTNDGNFYVAGVGTRFDLVGKVVGGVFGAGELPRLNEAYDHLCQRWAAGDTAIDIVGFSRGAATTLDFCHLIQSRKIRRPGADTVIEPNPRIRFLGVWDVVGAFGLANLGGMDLNIGHHLELPKANLQYAFHAMALDERRLSFLQTRLPGAYEVWFRGVHSDVGGGNGNLGLNDVALKWMMSKAKAAGLPIKDEDIAALHPDPTAPARLRKLLTHDVRVVAKVDRYHYTVTPEEGCRTPPGTCTAETAADERTAREVGADGLQLLPPVMRARLSTLVGVADATAAGLKCSLDGVREALNTLLQGRLPLVDSDDKLAQAKTSTARLVTTMVAEARKLGFDANEFALNKALYDLWPIFPFSDD